MKQRRLSELKAMLAQPDFQEWWNLLTRKRVELDAARKQHEELLSQKHLMEFRAEMTQKRAIDTLYQAGEFEDSATGLLAKAAELENRSFRTVAEFEDQRFRVSELWYRLGPLEKSLDEIKARKAPPSAVQQAQALLQSTSAEYEKQSKVKNELWSTVEKLWEQSSEVSLLVAEQRMQGKKVRRQAELLFTESEERKQRAQMLRGESEKALQQLKSVEEELKALRENARQKFDCTAGTDFLYFRSKDDPKTAFGIPLADDRDTFNIEVKALNVYVVRRAREDDSVLAGAARSSTTALSDAFFLEPAREETRSPEEGDRRFEQYFMAGRKT